MDAWLVAAWWYAGWLAVTYAAGMMAGWWIRGRTDGEPVAVQRDRADTIRARHRG